MRLVGYMTVIDHVSDNEAEYIRKSGSNCGYASYKTAVLLLFVCNSCYIPIIDPESLPGPCRRSIFVRFCECYHMRTSMQLSAGTEGRPAEASLLHHS